MATLSRDEVRALVRVVETELDNIRQGGADLNNIPVTARTAVYSIIPHSTMTLVQVGWIRKNGNGAILHLGRHDDLYKKRRGARTRLQAPNRIRRLRLGREIDE